MKISLAQAREYNIVKNPIVKTTVACILVKNNKILLTKRSPDLIEGDKWCFPGGHMDIGETPEESTIREVEEETGLEIKNLKFLFYSNDFLPSIKSHNFTLVFYGEPHGDLKDNEEVTEFGWFTKDESLKLDLAFKCKEAIVKFFKEKK